MGFIQQCSGLYLCQCQPGHKSVASKEKTAIRCVPSVMYLHVRCVSLAVPPGPGHRGESAVSMVKLSPLEVQEERSEGLLRMTRNRRLGFAYTEVRCKPLD